MILTLKFSFRWPFRPGGFFLNHPQPQYLTIKPCCSTLPLVFRCILHQSNGFVRYFQAHMGNMHIRKYKSGANASIANSCCKNRILPWCDYYSVIGNEKHLERLRNDLQVWVWEKRDITAEYLSCTCCINTTLMFDSHSIFVLINLRETSVNSFYATKK